nr:YjdF family protein [uncultured Oscillibacter sp.]
METGYARLTVYFEDPFWVGLYERGGGGTYQVCRIVFGAEPRDQEVYALLLEQWRRLRFSPSMAAEGPVERRVNPKRMRRQIKRELQSAGTGTKARQALKLRREQGKETRKRQSRAEREAEAERQLALRREKRREKHRGH